MSQVDRLNAEQQQQVLEFTTGLTRPRGTPGPTLLERMKHIHIEPADLAVMEKAIEEEFEKVDSQEWDKPIFPD